MPEETRRDIKTAEQLGAIQSCVKGVGLSADGDFWVISMHECDADTETCYVMQEGSMRRIIDSYNRLRGERN